MRFSSIDTLTGAYNRRFFESNLEWIYGHYSALLDLDNFKRVNDSEGHLAGDQVLSGFVKFVKDTLAGILAVIRMGGDEFCIIFANGFTEEELNLALQSVRTQFETKYSSYSYLSFSYGLGPVGHQLDETLLRLDKRMYANKMERKISNRV